MIYKVWKIQNKYYSKNFENCFIINLEILATVNLKILNNKVLFVFI